MRIAYDSNIFTMQKYGGVSRYMVRLGEELSKMGHELEVFGWLHKNQYLLESKILKTQMRYIHQFPKRTRRIAHYMGDLMADVRIKQWRPDVIHESFCHSRSVGSKNTPRVCTIHDLIHHKFPEYRGKMNRIPEYQQQTINRCDAVICVSQSTKQDLLKCLDVDQAKVFVVYHGFEHACGVAALNPTETAELTDLSSAPFLLYVGPRSGYKNFHGFLKALVNSRFNKDLRVVAFGGDAFSAEELALIRQLGYGENKVLHRGGSDALLGGLYRAAEAFVYPSLYEGFGFPPLEAMAEGCPVISSNASSMPEVIGNAAEFFDPSKTESITEAIEKVISSESRRRELREKGTDRIGYFPWSKCIAATEEIYRGII